MSFFIEALRSGGIWTFGVLLSVAASFCAFFIWYVLLWMKKNPNPLFAILPLCFVPLVCLTGAMIGLSQMEAALQSDAIPPDQKQAMQAIGAAISLYTICFLGPLVLTSIVGVFLSALPALKSDTKDKTLPIVCLVCYFLCAVLGGLALSKSIAALPLIVISLLLGIATAGATCSRSPDIGENAGFVSSTMGFAAIAALYFSSNALSYIEMFQAFASMEAEQKTVAVVAGLEQIKAGNMWVAPTLAIALIPPVLSATQQKGGSKIAAIVSLLLVICCFGILFFIPNLRTMTLALTVSIQ